MITISAFLLGVKANLHRWQLIERRIHMACFYFHLALFTHRTIGMTSFSVGTNGPSELPCTQPGHMGK